MKRLTLAFATAIIIALGTFTLRSILMGSPASNPSVSSPAPSVSAATNSASSALPSRSPAAGKRGLVENYGKLPLSFEANQGQTDPQVKFLSRGRGYALFLTGDEAVLSLRKPSAVSRDSKLEIRNSKLEEPSPGPSDTGLWPVGLGSLMPNSKSLIPYQPLAPGPQPPAPEVVRLKLVGASPKAKVVGLAELPGKSNYFIGNDPKKWRTNVANYARVKYQDVYAGIDLVYYGNQQQLEYDFVVAPGGDPRAIRLEIETGNPKLETRPHSVAAGLSRQHQDGGVKPPLRIDPNGDLVIATETGDVRLHKPLVFQPTTDNGQLTTDSANPKSQIQNRKSLQLTPTTHL